MKRIHLVAGTLALAAACFGLLLLPAPVSAHCDTLDGPVVQDAQKALDGKDVTPVLKWVRARDEKRVTEAFKKALAARGKKQQKSSEKDFFAVLVRIHREGEGAPFTGLKPAGTVEPVIAEADKALAGGSAEGLVRMIGDAVTEGIRLRYEKVAEALRHKDENVEAGRRYVEAYVEYTHYVERLYKDAEVLPDHHPEPAQDARHQKHRH
jgi:hypothetical protein